MSHRTPLPEPLADLPFSRQAATKAGVSNSRLRASDLLAPFHGVRIAADNRRDLFTECRAYQAVMSPNAAFSHRTAALLWGLPIPGYFQEADGLAVSVSAPYRAPAGRRIVGHRISAQLWRRRELIRLDGGDIFALPVISPEVVWAQLALQLDVIDLVALGDAIISGNSPLATLEDLSATCSRWTSRPGGERLRKSLTLVREGAKSRPESLLRVQCLIAGLPEPRINEQVQDRFGTDIAEADLSWPEYRTLVEYESIQHHTSAGQFRRDIRRHENYHDGDWHSLRATGDDVFGDPNALIQRVARRLYARGWANPRGGLRQVAGARR